MSETPKKGNGQPRVGVYVCHCGSNIAGTVDVAEVARWAGEALPGVVVSRDYRFMCSSLGQEMIEQDIKAQKLDRVVVAACSPHLHEKTFRRACSNAGLNPYLFQMANIREHVSWCSEEKGPATDKARATLACDCAVNGKTVLEGEAVMMVDRRGPRQ